MSECGWGYKIPVSSSEFLIIVLATAAKTSRMFDVSVACVMLQWSIRFCDPTRRRGHSLRIHAELCSVCLHEPPQDILGRLVYIRSTRVLLEVLLQRHLEDSWFTRSEYKMAPVTHPTQLAPEDVDLIQEQNNGRPEKPPRIDYRIEEDERFGHPILGDAIVA